ncbi:hypothetical protein D2E51_18260 [Mycobacteroides abscessus]|uniref:Uncharacterized protein n=1 Tax=Mycobacteroides abscessus subsp. bolletii CRM-0020 TaxID=1306401 RepID=A0A829I0X6_9MYCO|nr:hypothetical protein MYCMA_13655 [Mycobacteroides abscessus subsp. massiliense str. GO 06]AWG56394.1 hypothetical protein DDT53_20740 [Mycobacteroides abscessus]EPQ25558.1 hypothetical protein J108_00955 [Mycobacteroides abscessus subsp. bolletii CRM-0020]QCO28255.1 hypothetical protein CFE69_22405 [Mycobacteroides abscessus subsp. massiliense]AWG61193.1 hypothetical protein DDT47_20745 [Mycobacteroides abscessus]
MVAPAAISVAATTEESAHKSPVVLRRRGWVRLRRRRLVDMRRRAETRGSIHELLQAVLFQ